MQSAATISQTASTTVPSVSPSPNRAAVPHLPSQRSPYRRIAGQALESRRVNVDTEPRTLERSMTLPASKAT